MQSKKLGPTQKKILEQLSDRPLTLAELRQTTGLTSKAIHRAIDRLRANGFDILYDQTTKTYYIGTDDIDEFIKLSIERARALEEKRRLKENAIQKHLYDIIKESLGNVDFGDIKYKSYKKSDKSEQAVVMVFSDVHFGRVTTSYNSEIALKRLDRHIDAFLNIAEIESTLYDNVELDIFMLGDIVDGETIFPSQPFNIDKSAFEQAKIFAIALVNKLVTLRQYFPKINVYCVYGNHGRSGKYNSRITNWDNVMYTIMEVATANVPDINFIYPDGDEKMMVAEIYGYKFLLAHGDMINMHYQIPYYGITNKSMRWYQTFDGIDYMVLGHFHHHSLGTQFINTEYFINGSYLTDDTFSKEVIGSTNKYPSQIAFGVHRKYGVTWRYPIYLEVRK